MIHPLVAILFAILKSSGDADVLAVMLVIVSFSLLAIFFAFKYEKKSSERREVERAKREAILAQRAREEEMKRQALLDARAELESRCGKADKTICLGVNDLDREIRVYMNTRKIFILGKDYDFDSILNCKLTDNATTEHGEVTISSSGDARTSGGSMVGRAVVGSLVAGPAGAIICGATAKQNTSTTSVVNQGKDTTNHDYTVWITVKDILDPMVQIHIGKDEVMANEIVALMNAIIASKE